MMANKEIFNSVFQYKDGVLFKKLKSHIHKGKLKIAGTTDKDGYRAAMVNYKNYKVHRIIWIMFNGSIPNGIEIDHINRDVSDNRIENLRLATRSQNLCNTRLESTSISGYKGVKITSRKGNNKWYAMISLNKKSTYLGQFDTPELAHEAYKAAAILLHGTFTSSSDTKPH